MKIIRAGMDEFIQQLYKVNEETKNPAFERAAEEVGDIINNRRGLEAAIALLNSTSTSSRFSSIPSSPSWSTKSEAGRRHLIFQPSQDLDCPRTSCSMEQGSWKNWKRGLKSALYKTETCRNWRESQTCPYGRKCQYAHGDEELRQVVRPPRYKTKPCREYYNKGFCNYGQRCHFLHKSPSEQDTVSLPGDGSGVGASWLERSSGFANQFGIWGNQNHFSQLLAERYPVGDACFHEFDMASSPMGQWCSTLIPRGSLKNQCSTFQPQFALQHSIGFVGCTTESQFVPTWSFVEPQTSGLNPVQGSRFMNGDPPASATPWPGILELASSQNL